MKKGIIFIFLLVCSAAFAEATKLTFFIPSGATTENSRMYHNLLQKFHKENTGIKVTFKPMTSYDMLLKKVLTLNEHKKGGWVAVVEVSDLLTLKDKEAIMPLEKWIDAEPGGKANFLKQFITAFLGNCYGDDEKLYGLPFYRSTPIIYYNLDILKTAGVDTSKLPETWVEFEAMLETVNKSTGRPPFLLASTWYGWLLESFVLQNGGALANATNTQVLFDKPETIEALEFWKRLYDKELMVRIKGSWKATMNGFVQGNWPVIYYSTGGMNHAENNSKFTWTSTLMPKNIRFGAGIGGATVLASDMMTGKQAKAAWELIKFFMRPEIQAEISAQSGYFPVVSAAFENAKIRRRYTKHKAFKQARRQLEFAHAKIMVRNYNEVRAILKKAINATLDDDIPAKQSLKTAQQEAQKWIK